LAGLKDASNPELNSHGFASRLARQQYAALAWARFRMFAHSLRSKRGGMDFSAGILTYAIGAVIALGPSVGLGFGAWMALTHHHPLAITAESWAIFLVWQFLSAMAPALAGQNPEMNHLLRYPLSFGSWVLLYLVYGLISPSSIIGGLWCTALWVGIGVARPDLLGWAALALSIFALFNLLLSRAVLAWVERWMAQRRTREILTVIFLCVAFAAQLLNPALYHHTRKLPFGLKQATVTRASNEIVQLQRYLPPGLASSSVLDPAHRRRSAGASALGALLLWMVGAGGVLIVRLQAESRGENLSEAPRRSAPVARTTARSRRRPGFSGPIAAVFEKDLRYLLRSGPMIYALATPPVMVFLFSSLYRQGSFASVPRGDALPLSLIWAFLGLTRLVYNNFGAEGAGIQCYFLSPTPARAVVLGKNALYLLLFAIEAILIAAMVVFRFGPPGSAVAAATIAWVLFAIPANFAAGNVLSILMPYRTSTTRMKGEPGSIGNTLLSMFIQFAILGIGVAVFLPFAVFDKEWLATPVLLALAALSTFVYVRILGNVDRMVEIHRESLTLEVMKTR
jgi:ABC-2 type transport system permease protein